MEYWQEQIRDRLHAFHRGGHKGIAVSIKVRVTSGCFCRGCCPAGNQIIDEYRHSHQLDPRECEYVEHESGPELLLCLGLGAATLSIVKSVIELVVVIVKARHEGQRKGDRQHDPLIIVVRGFGSDGGFHEKQVLQVNPEDPPTDATIKDSLENAIQLIAEERGRQDAS